jgi:hypothetical protein
MGDIIFHVGDLVRVKNPCEGRIEEVWGEPLRVEVIDDTHIACRFTPDGTTWFAQDGVINWFSPNEIEHRVPRTPTWEI